MYGGVWEVSGPVGGARLVKTSLEVLLILSTKPNGQFAWVQVLHTSFTGWGPSKKWVDLNMPQLLICEMRITMVYTWGL